MNKHLLIVDDDRLVLATMARSLRRVGYAVKTADRATHAMDIAAENVFDLAILDIAIPDVSGIDLGRELRARYGLYCLFLTAHSDPGLVADAILEGAGSYLVKPIGVAQLVPAIEVALARANDVKAMVDTMEHLERALAGGRHISIAIGMLMERHALNERSAFEILRKEARMQRRKMAEHCAQMVAARGHVTRR